MPSALIQWFPGHMAKTRRLIAECLPDVDLIIELRDARIPLSSQNPEIQRLCASKPILTLCNKSSLSDPQVNAAWKRYYEQQGQVCRFIDCQSGEGVRTIPDAIKELMQEKLKRYQEKNMQGRELRAMVVGIPNVGKSSFINRMAKSAKARVEDRPGVTREKQWISTNLGISLLDMPGILWPKFEDQRVGENLAMTGAVKDDILDTQEIAARLCGRLRCRYGALLAQRYKLDQACFADDTDYELLERIGRRRGFLCSGAEVDLLRTAVMLLDEFRGGKIGRLSLETPLPPKQSEPQPQQEESHAESGL